MWKIVMQQVQQTKTIQNHDGFYTGDLWGWGYNHGNPDGKNGE